jgi:TonB-dependent starch-binding outer membrane protein SusC
MKLKLQTILLLLLLCPLLSIGQKTISGTVTDFETGEGLIGASILIVGTSKGTVTDFDGNFSLMLAEGNEELTFSYTGYTSQTIAIGTSDMINVQLKAGTVLDQVVVIGYGTVKKEDATGAVQTVSSKDFNRGAITSAQELLSGKVAGVQIITGGDPGGGATIRIRGGSSLSASNDPLIVIDGVPIAPGGVNGSRNPLNIINPNDIESVTVLKDASATAIYGSRASNGVIIVTTKKGKLGKKIGVNYSGSVGISNRANEVDVLNATEYKALIEERFDETHPSREILGDADTDWQDEIYQTALFHDHNLSLSGGIGQVPYRVSLGFTDKDGILKTDNFNRTTVGVNLSPGFIDNRLQINVNFKGSFSDNHFADRGAIGNAVRFDPTQPVYVDDQTYGGYYTWLQANGNGQPNNLAPTNPLALLYQRDDISTVNRYITNFQVDYRFGFLPELRANLNLGYDYSKGEGTIDVPNNTAFAFNTTDGGGVANTYSQNRKNALLDFYLNYVKTMGVHKVDVMGGYSWQHFKDESEFLNSNITGSVVTSGDDASELYLLSLFGRFNYTFQDKYIFTFTVRRDATSRFSEDTRWGLFPAAAIAYKILDSNNGFVNNLKVRLGYGVTGQQDIGGYYVSQARYLGSFENAQYPFGGTNYITLRPEAYDANIKWEETTTYNLGLDYTLWNDRVYGAIEYYQRKTKDLINFIPVPAGSNFANAVTTNVGDLENKGVEFSVNIIPLKTKDLYWDFGFNVSLNKNEITRLTATDDPTYQGVLTGGIGGGVGNTIQIHSVGYPANSFYVYEQVYDEDGNPIEGEYVDRDGNGMISPDDRYRKENPAPDAFIGFTSMLTYKDFEFSFAGRSNIGNYVYNNVLSERAVYNDLYQSTRFLSNVHAETTKINFEVPQYFSDYYIQNASFLRIDHITVGYNFNNLFNNKISRIKLFATVQNPILITKYDGLDPEISGGIDGSIYPRSTTYLFGLNVNL